MGFLIGISLWIAIARGKLSAADIHAIHQAGADLPLTGERRRDSLWHLASMHQ